VAKNPLDPYAFDVESRPFSPAMFPSSREEQLGVHTTPEVERAFVYALQRAALTYGDEPNCAIVFELDTGGLEALPDIDAAIEAHYGDDTLTEMLREPEIAKALAEGDAEALADAVADWAEYDFMVRETEGFPGSDYLSMAWYITENYNRTHLPRVLADMDPDELLGVLREAKSQGGLPLEIWAGVVGQHRYMTPIGLDRVRSIIAFRPVRSALWGYGEGDPQDAIHGLEDAPEDPLQPQIMYEDAFYEDAWLPDAVVLWENKQYPLFKRPRRVEYHGTDLTRARQAFPELVELAECPWPYRQE
jgi:hypothetical protein